MDLQELFQANICSDYKPVFNNIIGVNDWEIEENHEMREPKLDREAQQIFNGEADAAIQESNANVLPQMLASSKVVESTISEKLKNCKTNKISSLLPKLNQN